MDSDIKTRVTPLDELKLPTKPGSDCLVIIYSSDARQFGKRHVLGPEPVLLGRGSENTIVLENDSVSRRHCKIERRGRAYHVEDLSSTNGTYVNDELISDYQLRRGDQVKVGDTIFKFLSGSDMEAQYHETIYKMTIVDGLTGVNNKRFLMETLEREIPRARRHQRPLALVMFDIDHFKDVNDSHGHDAGDRVLKEVTHLMRVLCRQEDAVVRYGGEEFLILLLHTSREGAAIFGERLRENVEEHEFRVDGGTVKITISAGISSHPEDLDDAEPEQMIKRADNRLYQAKNDGRNRVVYE